MPRQNYLNGKARLSLGWWSFGWSPLFKTRNWQRFLITLFSFLCHLFPQLLCPQRFHHVQRPDRRQKTRHNVSLRNNSQRSSHLSVLITHIDLTEGELKEFSRLETQRPPRIMVCPGAEAKKLMAKSIWEKRSVFNRNTPALYYLLDTQQLHIVRKRTGKLSDALNISDCTYKLKTSSHITD